MKKDDARGMFYGKDKTFTNFEDRLMARDKLVFNITEDILVAMEFLNISKADLARELSKSKSYVTQILSGERNMTLSSLSDICFALGIEPDVKICADNQPYYVQCAGGVELKIVKHTMPHGTPVTEQKFENKPWRQLGACL